MKSMLIVYYSQARGNTARIAEMLRAATGADVMRIDTEIPYPDDYNAVVEQGEDEVRRGFEPKLKKLERRVADYDVIAVGTPTWWYTMAPAVRTFLHGENWQGKTVIPFATNGGWPGHVIKDMTNACAGAEVVCPMEIRFDSEGGARLETPGRDIDAWCGQVAAVLKQ